MLQKEYDFLIIMTRLKLNKLLTLITIKHAFKGVPTMDTINNEFMLTTHKTRYAGQIP